MDAPRHRLEVACPSLREQEREEVDLEEQVAELVEQLRVVARERRVGDLVGLLDGVRHDRARGLLAVPGAVAAQALGQLLELEERPVERGAFGATTSARTKIDSFAVIFVLAFVSQPVVVAEVVVAGGARPAAYFDLLGELTSGCRSSHFWSEALRSCWSSCWRIASFTWRTASSCRRRVLLRPG